MATPLTPIQTHYAGFVFRSRLEARWAVFLDHLRVRYDYEPEGFDLATVQPPLSETALGGKEEWYLPDFWLPDQATWLEIKPTAPTPVERERANRLAFASQHAVVIVTGNPWVTAETLDGYDGSASGYYFMTEGSGCDEYYLLTACPFCGRVGWCFSGWAGRLPCACPNEKKGVGDFARVQRAYLAARRARFEHGETPQGHGGI